MPNNYPITQMDLLDEDINVVANNYSDYLTLNEDIELVIFDFNDFS